MLMASTGLSKVIRIVVMLVVSTSMARAVTYLNYIPGPDETGGMVMPAVNFNISQQSISITLGGQPDTVNMYSLQDYYVGGTYPYANSVFNPAMSSAGWYGLLDPTQDNLPFSTQFGFYVTSGNVELLPADSYVYIKVTSISQGLKGYDVGYWADVWGSSTPSSSEWLQVYGDGSLWNNNVAWGDNSGLSMWHPVFVSDGLGLYSATFEVYLGDGFANPIDGWTSASITLNWNAIPEPSAAALLMGAGLALLMWHRSPRFRAESSGSV